MDNKIRQAEAEQLLNNRIFNEALAEYAKLWEGKALDARSPDDAFRVCLAKQAASDFVRMFLGYIDDGKMEDFNRSRMQKVEKQNKLLER